MSAQTKAEKDPVIVTETERGNYEQSITIGEHHLTADEPIEIGGGNRGPDPYQYLTAALGACTAITLRMYAERKKWPLEKVSVSLTHSKDHAEECLECDDFQGGLKIDVWQREITLSGDLSEEQRARLLKIADMCPVHRTLESEAKIRTSLTEAANESN